MSNWTNKWKNDWKNEWTIERIHKWTIERMNKRTYERRNECAIERMEGMNKWIKERMNERTSEQLNEWTNEWLRKSLKWTQFNPVGVLCPGNSSGKYCQGILSRVLLWDIVREIMSVGILSGPRGIFSEGFCPGDIVGRNVLLDK